jgi:hypothetical protein
LQKWVVKYQINFGIIFLKHSLYFCRKQQNAFMSQDSSSNPPERFLLIRTDRIGDTILTLIPAAVLLHQIWTRHNIGLLFGCCLKKPPGQYCQQEL